MSTKAQLYAQLTATNSLEQSIIRDCKDLKELKDELVYIANKFYAIESQLHKQCQHYSGRRYFYTPDFTKRTLSAVHNIASKLNYEIYSPNGAWFIKTI